MMSGVRVFGFWSSSAISIYVNYGFSREKVPYISISASSGGRDTDAVKDDADAYHNYGMALLGVSEFVKGLDLEALRKERVERDAEYSRQEAEARAAREAKIAEQQKQEPALSREEVLAEIKSIVNKPNASVVFVHCSWASFGEEVRVTVTRTEYKTWTLSIAGNSRWPVVEHCANMSKINSYFNESTKVRLA